MMNAQEMRLLSFQKDDNSIKMLKAIEDALLCNTKNKNLSNHIRFELVDYPLHIAHISMMDRYLKNMGFIVKTLNNADDLPRAIEIYW